MSMWQSREATLTDEQTSVELNWADSIKLNVNPESLKSMNIRYLFSTKDNSELLARYDIVSEYVAGQDGYSIYRLYY